MTQKNLDYNLNEKDPLLDECLNKVRGVVRGIRRNLPLIYPFLKKNQRVLTYNLKNLDGKDLKIYSEVNSLDKGKRIRINTADNIIPEYRGDNLRFRITFSEKKLSPLFNKKRLNKKIDYALDDFNYITIHSSNPIHIFDGIHSPGAWNSFLEKCFASFKRHPEETTFLLKNISNNLSILLNSNKLREGAYQNSLNSLNEISDINSEVFNKAFYHPAKYKNPNEFKETFLALEEGHQREIANYVYNLKNNENKEIKAWLLENFPAFIRK